ncbi:MAG: DNA polymerase [Gemmataceae bacterium]
MEKSEKKEKGSGFSNGKPSFVYICQQDDLKSVLEALDNSSVVAVDLETTGLDPRKDRIRLVSLQTEEELWVIDAFAVDITPLFDVLSKATIVGHNLKFDLQFLMQSDFQPGLVACTMVMSQLFHGPRQDKGFHSLADTLWREVGVEISKDEKTSDWASPELSDQQLEYAANDVAHLLWLYDALKRQIDATKQEKALEIEMRCLPSVAWMGLHGVGFDRDAWIDLANEAKAEAKEIVEALDREAPTYSQGNLFGSSGWNWSSSKQVCEVFQLLGIEVTSSNDRALAAIDHPLATLLRQYRNAKKRETTYGTDWLSHVDPDVRVYASWVQLAADTGRMSCRSPNLQQLPRDSRYRECFVAPPGRTFVVADYSQIELRIAAKIAKEEMMIEAYKAGEDLHRKTAQLLLGKDDISKDDRQLAKSANFGLLFGMGVEGYREFAFTNYGVQLTQEEAKEYRDAFFQAYPALRKWHRRVGRTNKQAIETRTISGRSRAGVTRFTEKLNSPVQGTGADGLKRALALLWQRWKECPGAFPVLAVHDEIVVECAVEQADVVKQWLEKAMVDGMQPLIDPVPVVVEGKISRTWIK